MFAVQIAHLRIENFRQFADLDLDFTDSLGRVRDLVVLVGPNASGKTTVLDAIAAAISPLTRIRCLRSDFHLRPSMVRRGALHARVTCSVRFSEDEVLASRELARILEADPPADLPKHEAEVVWEYPDPQDKFRTGRATLTFGYDSAFHFLSRYRVAKALRTGKVNHGWFERAGAVFTFDQQRTGMGKTIRRDLIDIIEGAAPDPSDPDDDRRRTDPQTLLLAMAVESLLPAASGKTAESQFAEVQQRYAQLCAPRKIVGAIRPVQGPPEMRFSDGVNEYDSGGMCSGEQMMLVFLLRMVTERIHRSIVLVDEIELHQHPVWQRKLLHLLPRMGEGNQVILTTHSPYVRDASPAGSVVTLGELGEVPARGQVP